MPDTLPSIPLDDLQEGTVYHFQLRGGYVRGPFAGFVSKKGEPLVVMVAKARDVISFPVTEILEIHPWPRFRQ